MKDRLAEQKVQVYRRPGRVLKFVWLWTCLLHDCPAEVRHGRHVLFEVAVHAGDAHARRFHHHRHTPHDL